jgi:ribose transport system permease protein
LTKIKYHDRNDMYDTFDMFILTYEGEHCMNLLKFWNRLRTVRSFTVFLVLIGVMIIATILSPIFIRPGNLVNIIRQISISGILAIGMTFVLLTGGIDLSVGSTVGVVAVVAAAMYKNGLSPGMAIPAALGIGAFIGFINGLGVTKGGIPPFIFGYFGNELYLG